MFARECEMAELVHRWLTRESLDVKREFVVPWGICDFVAVELNPAQVEKRIRLGQLHPIGPLHRVQLLMRIPDVESGKAISLKKLDAATRSSESGFDIENEIQRLIAARFVVQGSNGRLQKLNGWAPLHNRIVAVELKLSRIADALAQAASHRAFATETYVAMPRDIAERVAGGRRSADFGDAGVGVIAVAQKRCDVLLPARPAGMGCEPVLQMHCVERFWRTRGSSS